MKYVQTRMKSMTFVTYNLYAGVVFIIAIFRYELPKNFVNTNFAFFDGLFSFRFSKFF